MTERRIRTTIRTEFQADSLRGTGCIENLSEGGMFVGTTSLPEQGECVRVRFRAAGQPPVEVQGLVWWTTARQGVRRARRPGFGLRLLDAGEPYRSVLERLG